MCGGLTLCFILWFLQWVYLEHLLYPYYLIWKMKENPYLMPTASSRSGYICFGVQLCLRSCWCQPTTYAICKLSNHSFSEEMMKYSESSLRIWTLFFAISHLVIVVFIQLKLLTTIYEEAFYHQAIIPIGFIIILNAPFLTAIFMYSYCLWSIMKRRYDHFKVFAVFQAIVVGILFIATIIAVSIKFSRNISLKEYDMIVLTMKFMDKSFEFRLLDTAFIGIICLTVIESYWLVIFAKFDVKTNAIWRNRK